MPKHNPKLDQPNGKRGKEAKKRAVEESYDMRGNYTQYAMTCVFIIVMVVVVVLVSNVFKQETVKRVGRHDLVQLNYEIYSLDQYNEHEYPEIKETSEWVNACSRYDSSCKYIEGVNGTKKLNNQSLILGFYNQLLNKKEGDLVSSKLIKACIDKDMDGKDDYSVEDALSYGFVNDTLYDKDIVLTFKILSIRKKSSPQTSASLKSSTFQYIMIYKKELISIPS